jgi:actin
MDNYSIESWLHEQVGFTSTDAKTFSTRLQTNNSNISTLQDLQRHATEQLLFNLIGMTKFQTKLVIEKLTLLKVENNTTPLVITTASIKKVAPEPPNPILVIDSQSTMTKVGFAGKLTPHKTFPTKVGYQQYNPGYRYGCGQKDWWVGDECDTIKITTNIQLKVNYCIIERGLVINWDDLERIWHDSFYNVLRVPPEEHPLFITEPILNPKAHRERITQMMFETFMVPKLIVHEHCTLSLFACEGRTTGIVLDSGYHLTRVVPILNGCIIPHAIGILDVGGFHVTEKLREALSNRVLTELNFTTPAKLDENDMKEKCCFVEIDVDVALKRASLPNFKYCATYSVTGENTMIQLKEESFMAPNIMFSSKWSRNNDDGIGVHGLLLHCVEKVFLQADATTTITITTTTTSTQYEKNSVTRNDFFESIVVCGGNTMFRGFTQRLQHELISSTRSGSSNDLTFHICNENDELERRKNLCWIGASMFAERTDDDVVGKWILKEKYEEIGPTIVHMQ